MRNSAAEGAELGRLIVEQAPDAMIYADLEGVIRVWNASATRVFGHTAEDAVGQNLDLIVPEQFRDAHWKGYDRALGEKKTKYEGRALPTRSVRADGETIYVELSFAIVLDGTGEPIGALAHARDITERREQERASRARVRELEEALAKAQGAG
jgi:PAS domain S-box-containing protein